MLSEINLLNKKKYHLTHFNKKIKRKFNVFNVSFNNENSC